jgi:hypothetical protein
MAFALKEFEEGLADLVSAPLQVGTVAAQVSLDSGERGKRKLSQRLAGSPKGWRREGAPLPGYFFKDVILKGLREVMAQECESRGVAGGRDFCAEAGAEKEGVTDGSCDLMGKYSTR